MAEPWERVLAGMRLDTLPCSSRKPLDLRTQGGVVRVIFVSTSPGCTENAVMPREESLDVRDFAVRIAAVLLEP